MTSEIKVQAYQDAWTSLSNKKEVTNLKYPEEKKHFDFQYNISDVECFYSLNSNVDMLRLEAVKKYENKTDLELSQISEEILKDTEDIRCTFYDNKIKFLKSVVFTGTEDAVAKTTIDNALESFISFIITNFYEEPEVEEVVEEINEIENEEDSNSSVDSIVYKTTEFEDVSNVDSYSSEMLPKRRSKNISDIKFPNLDDFIDEELPDNEENMVSDIMKDFVIPEISHSTEASFTNIEPNIMVSPSLFSSQTSISDLELRERNLLLKTQELNDKEAMLKVKEEEIRRLFLSFEPQKKELEARFAQLEQDKIALMNAKMQLEEKAKALSQTTIDNSSKKQVAALQKYILELKSNANEYENDIKQYEDAYNQIKTSYEVLKVDSNNKITTLNERVLQLQSENIDNVNKGNEEIERLKGVIEECKEETRVVESQKEEVLASLKEKEEELEAKGREVVHLQTEIAAIPQVITITKIKETLSEEGIETEIVTGDGGDLLVCENFSNCKLVVNCDLTLFYVEKSVKKPLKYNNLINQYNQEDIRSSYIIGNDKIICKSYYKDSISEVKNVIEKFDSFK